MQLFICGYVYMHTIKQQLQTLRKAKVWLLVAHALKAPHYNPVYTTGNTVVIIQRKMVFEFC